MNGIFNPDSKLMYYGSKFANLLILQFWTLLCCIPIITAGASFAAMHNVLLKIRRDEDSHITGSFFKAFKEDFFQATLLWLAYGLVFVILYVDFRFSANLSGAFSTVVTYALPVMALLCLLSLSWIFVLISRYRMGTMKLVRLALLSVFAHPLYTIVMTVLMLLPYALLFYLPAMPYVILMGFTLPGILRAMIYSKVFDQLESAKQEAEEAEESNEAE